MRNRILLVSLLLTIAVGIPRVHAQPAPAPPPAQTEPPKDILGRGTPRGTVLAFLSAGRKGEDDLALHYLNTTLRGEAAQRLAHQLYVVLDARLPPRLAQVSDVPEGSRANPLAPDEEVIGLITGASGTFEVIVERVPRQGERVWLFSKQTLDAVPAEFAEITGGRTRYLPRFLFDRRVVGVRLYEWLAIVIGLPIFYVLTLLLNSALRPLARYLWRRLFGEMDPALKNALPRPVRLLMLAFAGRWLSSTLPVSLLVRQTLSNLATMLAIVALAWVAVVINALVERLLTRRLHISTHSGTVSLLRVGRRLADIVIVMVGLLAVLRHFGVDPTPLLAGLGVGGIAVALAAQKTLENVIAGASLIFDQAVRVGDFLRVGTIEGTVEHIGLRSTRIRTNDRTVVSLPNGQIANMSLETLSARDKFWFHPIVGLRYETTHDQMLAVLDGLRSLLVRHAMIEAGSVRVRFLRMAAYSLDVEIFAYVVARDWPHFLEIQEELLLSVSNIVKSAGSDFAFPSQTMYMETINSPTPQLPTPK